MSIKKIAEMTGTSASTVSRVLNNPDYKCSDPTMRERIWRAAMELNYTPNEAARNLKRGIRSQENKHHLIEILITRSDGSHADPFFEEQLRCVETQIHENGCILSNIWHQFIFSDESKCLGPAAETALRQMAGEKEKGGHSDSLIIIGKCCTPVLTKLKKIYRHIVAINRNSSEGLVDEVTCDGQKIAALAVDHLLSLGHKRIAYVGKCRGESRYRGYCDVLNRSGLDIYPEYIIDNHQTEREGFLAMQAFFKLDHPPTAIYCANDITAIGVLKCLQEHGNMLYHPSVIASDDIEEGQYSKPMLSTVQLPKEAMARFALFLLLDHIRGGHKNCIHVEMEGRLLLRSSCTRVEEANQLEYYI